jgi:hypothetical protein
MLSESSDHTGVPAIDRPQPLVGRKAFLDPGAQECPFGEAKFMHIWLKDRTSKLTRVISYDH